MMDIYDVESAVGHVGVRNMAAFLYDYAKIVSDDESKRLYTVKLCLIDNEDSCNL